MMMMTKIEQIKLRLHYRCYRAITSGSVMTMVTTWSVMPWHSRTRCDIHTRSLQTTPSVCRTRTSVVEHVSSYSLILPHLRLLSSSCLYSSFSHLIVRNFVTCRPTRSYLIIACSCSSRSRNHFLLIFLLLSGDIELNSGPVNFTLCSFNIRSILHPLHSAVLSNLIDLCHPDLFCLTETWVKPIQLLSPN